jgi:hypothetical protein
MCGCDNGDSAFLGDHYAYFDDKKRMVPWRKLTTKWVEWASKEGILEGLLPSHPSKRRAIQCKCEESDDEGDDDDEGAEGTEEDDAEEDDDYICCYSNNCVTYPYTDDEIDAALRNICARRKWTYSDSHIAEFKWFTLNAHKFIKTETDRTWWRVWTVEQRITEWIRKHTNSFNDQKDEYAYKVSQGYLI